MKKKLLVALAALLLVSGGAFGVVSSMQSDAKACGCCTCTECACETCSCCQCGSECQC